ncbi:hypothetical protein SDC9_184241 [bioreactor metagenome]|uniref:Uncharacterized protein n=1 Tax=bioreactor metagenome TaxID=1076179 RepID=A0A645HCH9_9ZZZZ
MQDIIENEGRKRLGKIDGEAARRGMDDPEVRALNVTLHEAVRSRHGPVQHPVNE